MASYPENRDILLKYQQCVYLQTDLQVQFTSTGNDVLARLLDDTLHHRIRLRQTLETWIEKLLISIQRSSQKSKLCYNRQSVRKSILVTGTHLGPATYFLILSLVIFKQLWVC